MMDHFNYRYQRFLYVSRNWLFRQFTPMGLGVLACLVVAAITTLVSPQSLSHLLFFFAMALLASAAMGSRFIQYRFRATRTLPRFGTVGEPLQYQVTIQNLTPQAQLGLKFVEVFPETFPSFREFMCIKNGYPVGRRWIVAWSQQLARQRRAIALPQALPVLPAETQTKIKGEIFPLRRGKLSFGAIALDCPDPLGLIYKRHTCDIPQTICILPPRYQLPPLSFSHAKRYGMGEMAFASSIGEALEFRSLRDYRPGDPTNKIHWKSWAKVGRPIVKEHQDESVVHHGLILDTFQTDPHSDIFEEAITVAISFLTKEKPEESLLDIIFAAQKSQCITVGRGLRQRTQILETLATLTPNLDHSLDILIPIVQSRLPRLSGCFCIFTNLDKTRYDFLKMLIQYDMPTKVIFLCEQNILRQEDMSYYLSPLCRTHFISIDNMQQDLLLT